MTASPSSRKVAGLSGNTRRLPCRSSRTTASFSHPTTAPQNWPVASSTTSPRSAGTRRSSRRRGFPAATTSGPYCLLCTGTLLDHWHAESTALSPAGARRHSAPAVCPGGHGWSRLGAMATLPGATCTGQDVVQRLTSDGYVVVSGLMSERDVAAARADLGRVLEATPKGRNHFEGFDTQRVYALFAKTRTFDQIAVHPLLLDVLDRVLGHYQLSAPVGIRIPAAGQPGRFASMEETSSGSSGSVIGRYRAMTFPSGPTRNFSKFHWMSPASPAASGSAVNSAYNGCLPGPLTSIFSNIGKVTP